MATLRRPSCVGVLAVLVAVALFADAPGVGAASANQGVAPERWIRGVCRHTSDWLEARDAARQRVATVNAELGTGDLKAKAAARQLVQAVGGASGAAKTLLAELRTEGLPKLDGGKDVAKQYQQRVAEYHAAYEQARSDLTRVSTKDSAELVAAAQAIDATLTADLAEIGGDPLEDLRAVAGLATGISASCGEVDGYLGATVDTAGCRVALASAREYSTLSEQWVATPEGSPEETAIGEQLDTLTSRWRTELGGCNNAAVLGPCKPPLDTAQALVLAAAQFYGAPVDSPEEQTALDEWNRLDFQLVSQLPKCPA